ncbi:exonuclease subunit SbcD [Oerskovia turbata]|uniref:Nuclease SbcCD subunit D n=1 Tax=Oerskovia turbata TaxID=1713 RepID=A0A4Q1KRB3_9CELL|nr:exonuclease SbcCD subunit D [Oerskovia turbata]RXR22724.1 exonuclease subunit SbcD [Oerskovia turbata]RXR32060.1 exonuclease subunit SbcD [Oerskovia turbata]TGJ96049.1 exonuclease subunit SbcD [Actinotalea fermentans ATCC 43279 = JCM 9966 = DSM 3133]
MRILHTSDWHLGRTLHGVDLLDHQAAYLDHLVDVVRSEGVGAVLVAGDVYDRAIPPVDAVNLLSDTVARLAEHADVVLTPGNHDSAIRLGFGASLMRAGVHFRTRVPDVGTPVVLDPASRGGSGGRVAVYAMPYLDPDAVRWELADGCGCGGDGEVPGEPGREHGRAPLPRSHEAVTAAAMRRVRTDVARRREGGGAPLRNVVVAHAFVVGGQASESERDIRVGGVDSVPAGVFGGAGVDYVALGHLHGPQTVTLPGVSRETTGHDRDGTTTARYSGSPLAYSFSEMHQKKSTVLLDLDATGDARTELLPAPVPRRLAEVTGTLDDLLGASGDPHTDDWLRVFVTDPARPTEMYARVRARFPHALQVQHRPPVTAEREVISVVGQGRDPLEVTHEFVQHVTGTGPDQAERAALRTALERALASERSA